MRICWCFFQKHDFCPFFKSPVFAVTYVLADAHLHPLCRFLKEKPKHPHQAIFLLITSSVELCEQGQVAGGISLNEFQLCAILPRKVLHRRPLLHIEVKTMNRPRKSHADGRFPLRGLATRCPTDRAPPVQEALQPLRVGPTCRTSAPRARKRQ